MHSLKILTGPFRLGLLWQKPRNCYVCPSFTTSIDTYDIVLNEFQKHNTQARHYFTTDFNFRYFILKDEIDFKDITKLNIEELDNLLRDLVQKNKDKVVAELLNHCLDKRKLINDNVLKELFRHYSLLGKVDMVLLLQKYCSTLVPATYKRNGEFLHYVAKAQCFKGNSEYGLSILKQAYIKNEGLRGFYRVVFKDLIHDSVLNRSEASLVVFKKYVLEFSKNLDDKYPLVCLWHFCWSSNWFSDQMVSNELLETSADLRSILREKCAIFSANILAEYNDDAVIRLLQSLLKYNMMPEYTKVLQILFSYKLRNRDLKGCNEIIKNCDALGISLSSGQQSKYIRMLIHGPQKPLQEPPTKPKPKDFKLKF